MLSKHQQNVASLSGENLMSFPESFDDDPSLFLLKGRERQGIFCRAVILIKPS